MVLQQAGQPLIPQHVERPTRTPGHLLLRVLTCGLCRTDLHIIDGELKDPALPLIAGHQIVAEVVESDPKYPQFKSGDRVGVPWLGSTCGTCQFCLSQHENLCDNALFTGYHRPGGFAEYCLADAEFAFPIAPHFPDEQAAPLLCAGLIGYRAWRMAGKPQHLGIYGFGAAAHILCQVAHHHGQQVYAFTRKGDHEAQRFALELGACWAGPSHQPPPIPLDAAIIFAPVGELVPIALSAVKKGGRVICGGIHMSDIPAFPYAQLWGERSIQSVANLTRADAHEFLALAPQIPVRTEVTVYPLASVNEAIGDLRQGRLRGAAVIRISS